jgi:hypothetical protein
MNDGSLFKLTFFGVLSLTLSFIVPLTAMSNTLFSQAFAQNATTGNVTSSSTQQNDTLTQPGEFDLGVLQDLVSTLRQPPGALDVKMAQTSTSNDPADIATLAYIWGFPLVTMERQFNFVTHPNVPPGVGRAPPNMKSVASYATNLITLDTYSLRQLLKLTRLTSNRRIVYVCFISMSQNFQVCRKCGIVFDIECRKDKDCPLCHSGEHIVFRYPNDNNA